MNRRKVTPANIAILGAAILAAGLLYEGYLLRSSMREVSERIEEVRSASEPSEEGAVFYEVSSSVVDHKAPVLLCLMGIALLAGSLAYKLFRRG